ncbi:MAG: chloride channel protein [Caldicoprobacterales bacterium]
MNSLKDKAAIAEKFITAFIKWVIISALIGGTGGAAGLLFHICVERAAEFRAENSFTLWLLPIGGIIIAALYKLSRMQGKGTDHVLESIHTNSIVPASVAPVIFVSTVLTHLFGGSAGREGAALQLGGSIGSLIGRLFKLDKNDMKIVIMCGMSALFAALFGTPITAAIFAMEVSSIGIMHYSSFIPCMVAAFTASGISGRFGAQPVQFILKTVPDMSVLNMVMAGTLAALCAVLSIVFCITMKETGKLLKRLFKNEYIRIAAGGVFIIILTLACGTRDYNGAGMDVIKRAIRGQAVAYAFILKIIFTAVTIESGYKGGEIVPTFFIGATFGCIAGGILGLNNGFSAAIGMIAMFCGVVNCPVASLMLAIEVFSGQGVEFFALACAISYMLSGYYGIYSTQKIVWSKLNARVININTR